MTSATPAPPWYRAVLVLVLVLMLVVMGCKVLAASSGGCTHFLTTPDAKGGIMTVGFGQGCVSGTSCEASSG
jgi:hypothetical protein